MLKVSGVDDFADYLEQMQERLERVSKAIATHGSAEDAIEAIRKDVKLKRGLLQKRPMFEDKDDARAAMEAQVVDQMGLLVQDLEDMIAEE